MAPRFLLAVLLFPFAAFAQAKEDTTTLRVVGSYKAYLSSCAANPDNKLVELKKAIPGIILDVRYATRNNFMKQVMYKQARAFARKPVAEQLKKIQSELNRKGYGLKIFDAYRPYAVTVAFYKKASDKAFVANPKKGSKHNRGCAVDLTLVDLKTGKDIPMPTPYDSFAPEASPTYKDLPQPVIKNRDYLISVMHRHGFRVIDNEWWHYDFIGWKNYALMDIPFERL
ncbi:MAG TPA: M15 family metallopeptidase [Pedobacter sp.]|uniref:M15 family metallopeptidase n=1 Tax=Pedobacter sp. TaxID=1411316 RepID=UPI002BC5C467|nr:M15 family metallopeptidase [Pedobacter sp.]HMI01476.1 M15 family metallopeptidase [Pedobacter sp.]